MQERGATTTNANYGGVVGLRRKQKDPENWLRQVGQEV